MKTILVLFFCLLFLSTSFGFECEKLVGKYLRLDKNGEIAKNEYYLLDLYGTNDQKINMDFKKFYVSIDNNLPYLVQHDHFFVLNSEAISTERKDLIYCDNENLHQYYIMGYWNGQKIECHVMYHTNEKNDLEIGRFCNAIQEDGSIYNMYVFRDLYPRTI